MAREPHSFALIAPRMRCVVNMRWLCDMHDYRVLHINNSLRSLTKGDER
jgi:hypothetical protein